MSGEGNYYDKAFMENLFGHVKAEMYHGETFTSMQAFYRATDDCIPWYNNECIPKRLKGLTLIRSPAVGSSAPCTRNFSLNRPAHPATIFIPGALADGYYSSSLNTKFLLVENFCALRSCGAILACTCDDPAITGGAIQKNSQ